MRELTTDHYARYISTKMVRSERHGGAFLPLFTSRASFCGSCARSRTSPCKSSFVVRQPLRSPPPPPPASPACVLSPQPVVDLLHPSAASEKRSHKKKRLVQVRGARGRSRPRRSSRPLPAPAGAARSRPSSLPSPILQSPNSFFMDVRCPACYQITTVFSHATTSVMCAACAMMLCTPTGGKAKLTDGCSFRRKQD